MRHLPLIALALLGAATPALAQDAAIPSAPGQPYGPETVIPFASGGALREWQRGPNEAGYLFVKNRTDQWYRVELTGPCQLDRPLDTLSYTTDPVGNFDRFSRLRVARLPNQLCGVKSIRRSTPPPSRVGVARQSPAR